jgi:putative CocE/NonD family hydrolase
MRARLTGICIVLGCIMLGVIAGAAHAQTPAPQDNKWLPVQIAWDQKIRMRDGVKLSATIYRDLKQTGPLPVILTMTPYIADQGARQGTYFAQNGYVFVSVDLRGRGNSEGTFLPGQVEARDGYDTIEWIARQPWCNGQVATWGGSWLGFTQWSIAKEFPPHLKAIAPTASVHLGVDYPQPNGIFMSYMLRWLSYVHGKALNANLFSVPNLWINAEWEQVTTGRAFRELEDVVGIQGTVFRTWLAHPREDAFWQAVTPRPEHYAKLRIPVLTITGHYDADQLGALTYYGRHMTHGARDAIARHWLVIGPWDHSGTRRPRTELHGLTFGPSAAPNMEELHKGWYDHVLKGKPAPDLLKERVACFVMGRNTWVHASDLPRIEGPPWKLHLDLGGAVAGNVTRSGSLLAEAATAPATVTLTSDPRFVPPREELDDDHEQYLRDQRSWYHDRQSHVLWHSAPLAKETVIAGRPRLQLQLAVDQPDADLWFELSEVLPDGTTIHLSRSSIRLRYRRGGVTAVPMVPGKAERIDVPPMQFFARSLAKGSRLRLAVDAAPQFGWQRNSHTGGDLATEPGSAGRIAKITLMTGPGTHSALELPRPDDGLVKVKEEPSKTN